MLIYWVDCGMLVLYFSNGLSFFTEPNFPKFTRTDSNFKSSPQLTKYHRSRRRTQNNQTNHSSRCPNLKRFKSSLHLNLYVEYTFNHLSHLALIEHEQKKSPESDRQNTDHHYHCLSSYVLNDPFRKMKENHIPRNVLYLPLSIKIQCVRFKTHHHLIQLQTLLYPLLGAPLPFHKIKNLKPK